MEKHRTIKVGLAGERAYSVPVEAAAILRINTRTEFQRNLLREFRQRCHDPVANRALCEALARAWQN